MRCSAKLKAEFEKLGKDNPDLIRSMQTDSKSKEPPFKGSQEVKGPQEAKETGVEKIIGHGSAGGPTFVSDGPDDQNVPIEKRPTRQIRGTMDYDIILTEKGELIARSKGDSPDGRIVDAKLPATIEVDGKKKEVTIEIGKDGTVPKDKVEALLKSVASPAKDAKEQGKDEVQSGTPKPTEAVKPSGLDDIKDVLNKVNPAIKAKAPTEKTSGDRKIIKIETEAKVKDFDPEELAMKLKPAFAEASGNDAKDPKYKRHNVSEVMVSKGKDGNAVITIVTAPEVTIDPKMLAKELERPEMKQMLQGMASGEQAQAKDEVQNGKTIPAEPVKAGGLVEGAKIQVFAAAVSHRDDGKQADGIRGNAEFVITKNIDGKLIADLEGKGKQHLVPKPIVDKYGAIKETATQEVTATLTVDGKSKQITLEVAKDGTLTEKAPAATPKGNEKSAEPMR